MKTYTLTIAPDDGQGTQTLVNLQLDNGQPTITGLHLVALDNTGLSANQLPAINLELLLAAIMPATTPAPAPPATPAIAAMSAPALPSAPTEAPAAAPISAARTDTSTTRPRATNTTRAVAKTSPTTRKKAATAAKTAGKKAAPPSAKVKAAPRKAAKATSTTAPSSGRTYRTMPADIATVFAQAKSVPAIADFYQVPPHTATGWIRTARKRGLIPETTRRRSN